MSAEIEVIHKLMLDFLEAEQREARCCYNTRFDIERNAVTFIYEDMQYRGM